MKRIRIAAASVLLTAGYLGAQSSAETLSRLRALPCKEAPGPVSLIYSPASERRALQWQRALRAAHAWFQSQLGREAPVTFAVLDREDWKKATDETMPFSMVRPALILFPEHIEDLYPGAPKSIDPLLAGEAVTFHEAGHIFADSLKLDGNASISEFVANIFMAGYIRAARPDLTFMLNGPFPFMKTPRYTSGGDLNYLGEKGVGVENTGWFQMELQRLADFCLKGRSFAPVVGQIAAAFPAEHPRHVTIDEATTRLEALFPGFRAAAGPIGEPPTITRAARAACSEAKNQSEGEWRLMVVRNDTAEPLDVARADGNPVHVNGYAWRSFGVRAGTSVRISNGMCLAAGERGDPVLAIIGKP